MSFSWLYLAHGKVSHAVFDGELIRTAPRALCGAFPSWPHRDWFGTGTQAEYDLAAALPRCKKCKRAAPRMTDL